MFIGFLISALAIVSSQKAPTIVAVSIPLVSLGFPILDVALAVARRFVGGKPLFLGDRDHIHHKLLKRGLSQRQAVLLLYAVTAAFGFISLVLLHQATAIALILALTGIGVLIGLQQLRYNEFGEMLSILQRATRRRQLVANHVTVRHAGGVPWKLRRISVHLPGAPGNSPDRRFRWNPTPDVAPRTVFRPVGFCP